MNSVVRTFLLVSATYLLGGAAPAEIRDVLVDPETRDVEELRQGPGGALEDASPLAAAIESRHDPADDL